MGCILNANNNEGKVIEMSKGSRKAQNSDNRSKNKITDTIQAKNNISNKPNANPNVQSNRDTSDKGIYLPSKLFFPALGFVASFLVGICAWIFMQINEIHKEMFTIDDFLLHTNTFENTVNEKLSDLNEKLSDLNESISEIEKSINGPDGIYSRLSALETKYDVTIISASTDMFKLTNDINSETDNESQSNLHLTSETVVGTDSYGNQYIAKDLIGETVLLTYTENKKEIYFLGMFNEQYHWDGYCITNTYTSDGILHSICESNFKDGKRLDYKSFYYLNSNEWNYSNRNKDGQYNLGINIRYTYKTNKVKNFTNTNVRVDDILFVDSIINNENPNIISFYSGKTSNGKFNDNSGNAYYAKYNEDGILQYLYVGKMKNGIEVDTTGNAWSIAIGHNNDGYYYYKGTFSNGSRDYTPQNWAPMTKEQIDMIVENYNFECSLNGLVDD